MDHGMDQGVTVRTMLCMYIPSQKHKTRRETAAFIISNERHLPTINGFVEPMTDRNVRDQVDVVPDLNCFRVRMCLNVAAGQGFDPESLFVQGDVGRCDFGSV